MTLKHSQLTFLSPKAKPL